MSSSLSSSGLLNSLVVATACAGCIVTVVAIASNTVILEALEVATAIVLADEAELLLILVVNDLDDHYDAGYDTNDQKDLEKHTKCLVFGLFVFHIVFLLKKINVI
jgi:hypothetical protein